MILYGLNLEVDTYCLEDKENMEQSPKLKDKYLVGDIYLRWTIRTLVGLGLLPRLTYLCQLIYLFAKLPDFTYGQKFQKVENDENRFFAITSSKLFKN